jgi:hypothetical protein
VALVKPLHSGDPDVMSKSEQHLQPSCLAAFLPSSFLALHKALHKALQPALHKALQPCYSDLLSQPRSPIKSLRHRGLGGSCSSTTEVPR